MERKTIAARDVNEKKFLPRDFRPSLKPRTLRMRRETAVHAGFYQGYYAGYCPLNYCILNQYLFVNWEYLKSL